MYARLQTDRDSRDQVKFCIIVILTGHRSKPFLLRMNEFRMVFNMGIFLFQKNHWLEVQPTCGGFCCWSCCCYCCCSWRCAAVSVCSGTRETCTQVNDQILGPVWIQRRSFHVHICRDFHAEFFNLYDGDAHIGKTFFSELLHRREIVGCNYLVYMNRVESSAWMSNYIPHKSMDVIT